MMRPTKRISERRITQHIIESLTKLFDFLITMYNEHLDKRN